MESLEARNLLSGATGGGPVLADLPTQFVQEGSRLSFQARATDPDSQSLRYSLDPGAPDGATIDPTSGLIAWTPPNVQATYSLPIRVTEDGGPGLSDVKTLTVMVFNVPPNVQAGVNAAIDPGSALVRTGSFADPNPDTWSATVDYGDGSGVRPLGLAPDKTFTLNHAYATAGGYTVAVTINDSQGGQGRGFFAVQVQASGTTTHPSTGGTSPGQGTTGNVTNPTTGTGTGNGAGAGMGTLGGNGTGGIVRGQKKGKIVKHAPHPKPHPRPHVGAHAIHPLNRGR